MRTFAIFLSVATVATLAYVFGPDFLEAYHERETLVAERQVVALPEDAKRRDAQTFDAPDTGVKASLDHLRQVATVQPTKFKSTPKTKQVKNKTERKAPQRRRTAAAERAELQKLGLAPASKDLRLQAQVQEPVKMPRTQPIVSPMAGRWVDGLSGPKARLDMGLKDRDDNCSQNYSHCTRREAPTDVKFTGVVVKTERLVHHPSKALDGKFKTGHYLDETPAVYVE